MSRHSLAKAFAIAYLLLSLACLAHSAITRTGLVPAIDRLLVDWFGDAPMKLALLLAMVLLGAGYFALSMALEKAGVFPKGALAPSRDLLRHGASVERSRRQASPLETRLAAAERRQPLLLRGGLAVLALTWSAYAAWYVWAGRQDGRTAQPVVVQLLSAQDGAQAFPLMTLYATPQPAHALSFADTGRPLETYVPLAAARWQAGDDIRYVMRMAPGLVPPARLARWNAFDVRLEAAPVPNRVLQVLAEQGLRFAQPMYLVQQVVPNGEAAPPGRAADEARQLAAVFAAGTGTLVGLILCAGWLTKRRLIAGMKEELALARETAAR